MNDMQQLETVFRINDRLEYEIDDSRLVTILRRQDHWIQRFARKLRIRIPAVRRIEMDDFASFVFLSIDGQRTVGQIGEILSARFGDAINPLYERLWLFLNHIEKNERFIVRQTAAH